MFGTRESTVLVLLTGFFAFLSDRVSKIWAFDWLAAHGTLQVIPGFFSLRYGQNTGIAFGLFARHGEWVQWLSPIIFLVLVIFFVKSAHLGGRFPRCQSVCFGLILGGALGNLYDRILYRFVIDFLDFYVGRYHWPTFNLADSYICVGVVLLLLLTYLTDRCQGKPDSI